MKILISGASGLIGRHLTETLVQQGHEVRHLVRNGKTGEKVKQFPWDPAKNMISEEAIPGTDIIINLSGAPVAGKRWTTARKEEIVSSRVNALNTLREGVKKSGNRKVRLISVSGVNYYGIHPGNHVFYEKENPGDDFLGRCCVEWENAALKFSQEGIPVTILRVGIVLAKNGGALPKIAAPVKWFAGAPFGSGKQWMPWIHIGDLCRMFLFLAEHPEHTGIFNAVAPEAVNNSQFTLQLARTLHRPLVLPAVPGFLLRLVLGEMADVLLNGNLVSGEKIRDAGFTFGFPFLENALKDLYSDEK
ncbi:MAG TPA: TIGR01777 family oxidoreductase [Bacteroidia bacterium]|nr:TIGR01777 family oxidoreductase [Bacteroidia bacterium]